MSYNNFLYDQILRGYQIMGVNQKKIERLAQLEENKKEYQDFLKTMDMKPVFEYFKLGLEANQFKDNQTGKLLGKHDNLFWRFNAGGYQYLLCRRPIRNPIQNPNNPFSSIVNDILMEMKSK